MRVTEIVRIGGRLALLAGLAIGSLASANTISYFYGYSSPSLAAWQTDDAFASQNVQFVPQVPMVSSWGNYSSPWNVNYVNMNAANSYTGTTTTDSMYGGWSYSSSSFGANATAFNSPAYSVGGYDSSPAAFSSGAYSAVPNYYTPPNTFTNVNGLSSWNAWQMPSNPSTDALQIVSWQPIRDSALPPVSSNFTNPSVLPDILPPTNGFDPAYLGSPEPSTIGLMAAGLFGLLYLRRRRAA
jgi:hypothetical protein